MLISSGVTWVTLFSSFVKTFPTTSCQMRSWCWACFYHWKKIYIYKSWICLQYFSNLPPFPPPPPPPPHTHTPHFFFQWDKMDNFSMPDWLAKISSGWLFAYDLHAVFNFDCSCRLWGVSCMRCVPCIHHLTDTVWSVSSSRLSKRNFRYAVFLVLCPKEILTVFSPPAKINLG